MRSVIVFALIALAFCQSPLDAVNGLTSQLNINSADALNCVSGLYAEAETLLPLYEDLIHQDFQSLIVSGIVLIQGFEPAVQTACAPLVQDLINYIDTYGNGHSVEKNLKNNGAYVAQQVGLLVQYATSKNFTAIGSTIGYIFQIAVGAVDLPSLVNHYWTNDQITAYSQNVAMLQSNENGAMEVFLQSYVNELGLSEQVDASAIVQLINGLESFAVTVQNFESAIKSGNFDSDITATETFINTALELLRANKQGIESVVAIDVPVVLALERHPAAFIGSVVFNILLNAPEIQGFQQQYIETLIAGDFAGLGVEYANIVKDIYGAVYSN